MPSYATTEIVAYDGVGVSNQPADPLGFLFKTEQLETAIHPIPPCNGCVCPMMARASGTASFTTAQLVGSSAA